MRELHRKFATILWDVDGTLVNSNDQHAYAWQQALEKNGFLFRYKRIRQLIGMGGDKIIPELTGLKASSPVGRKISRDRAEIFAKQYLPAVQPLPMTRQLLKTLLVDGFDMAIASSAKKEEMEKILKQGQIDDLLTFSGEAENSKPSPDVLLSALEKISASKDAAIMIGDTPYDIIAAHLAAIPIISFRSGGWDDDDLKGSLAIYTDPRDFLAHLFHSPLYGVGATTGDMFHIPREIPDIGSAVRP